MEDLKEQLAQMKSEFTRKCKENLLTRPEPRAINNMLMIPDAQLVSWKENLHKKIVNIGFYDMSSPQDDGKRIKFILQKVAEGVKNSRTIPAPAVKSKSEGIASYYAAVCATWDNKNYEEKIIEIYTRALTYAEPNSIQMMGAYMGRGLAFYNKHMCADAAVDMERSMSLSHQITKEENYELKSMLLKCHKFLANRYFYLADKWLPFAEQHNQRRLKNILEKAKKMGHKEKQLCYEWQYKCVPGKLDSENPDIPGLSDAVEVKYSTEFGRHIVATRDIEPGEIIGMQKPFAVTVKQGLRYNICSHCQRQTWSSLPCDTCIHVVYCSETCKRKAHQAYHDIECTVVSQIMSFKIQDSAFLMGLRLTVLALKEANMSVEILKNKLEEIDASTDSVKKGFIDGKLQPDKFSSVHALASSYSPHLINYESASLASCIIVAYFLGEKIDLFSSSVKRDLGRIKNDDSFIFLVKLIEKNVRVTIYNSYTMSMPVAGQRSIKVSTAVVPAFSFFNHHCRQMIVHSRHDEQVAIRSICPIKKGEQIFDNYGTLFFADVKERRQQNLMLYNFVCKCECCVNDWDVVRSKGNDSTAHRIHLYLQYLLTAAHRIESQAWEHFREYNELLDLSSEFKLAVDVVKKYHNVLEINSYEHCMMLTQLLVQYVVLSQVPFVLME